MEFCIYHTCTFQKIALNVVGWSETEWFLSRFLPWFSLSDMQRLEECGFQPFRRRGDRNTKGNRKSGGRPQTTAIVSSQSAMSVCSELTFLLCKNRFSIPIPNHKSAQVMASTRNNLKIDIWSPETRRGYYDMRGESLLWEGSARCSSGVSSPDEHYDVEVKLLYSSKLLQLCFFVQQLLITKSKHFLHLFG